MNETGQAEPPKYRDKRTGRFAAGERVKEFEAFKDQAERRLDILEVAVSLHDLMRLQSNRFEALGGDRVGQFSIRIRAFSIHLLTFGDLKRWLFLGEKAT